MLRKPSVRVDSSRLRLSCTDVRGVLPGSAPGLGVVAVGVSSGTGGHTWGAGPRLFPSEAGWPVSPAGRVPRGLSC